MVLKGQYICVERASYKKWEYFTLGECCGPERLIHMSRENKLQQESQVASSRAVFPHCFLLFLICDILWCIISGVLRYLVSYLWCLVVYSCFLFGLSCTILLCLICCVLWYLVVPCGILLCLLCSVLWFHVVSYLCILLYVICGVLQFLVVSYLWCFLWFPLVFLSVMFFCVFVYCVLKILH